MRKAALSIPLGLAGPACGNTRTPDEGERARPNVVVFLTDTLRPDHLGTYGYERETSPHLDALAREGVVFEQAYSPTSWTRPATASLLTGWSPARHGAVTLDNRLPEDVVLISERLRELGYFTAAVVANVNVTAKWGFDQGFEHFVDLRQESRARADEVVDAALALLDGMGARPASAAEGDPRVPFFLYLHTIDPHEPYAAPEAFAERWRPDSGATLPPLELHAATPADDLAATIAAYDAEIAFNDAQLGRLVEGLRARGLHDETLFFFTSDHGEEFLEHGRGSHGHTLYEELVRIPMVIKFPGGRGAGQRVAARSSLLDVVPTILEELGEPVPGSLDGIPLAALSAGGAAPPRTLHFDLEVVRFKEVRTRGSDLEDVTHGVRSILRGDYKLIARTSPAVEDSLYCLARDRSERTDLAPDLPELCAELAAELAHEGLRNQTGFHLSLINAGDGRRRVYRGELTTDGRFVDVARKQFEDEDRATLAADGRRLTLRVTSRDHRPARQRSVVVDRDELSFRLEPPEAELRVVTLIEERDGTTPEAPVLYLGAAATPARAERLVFRADSDELLASEPRPARARGPAGAYLVSVPARARETVELDEETRARLQALGYVR